MFVACGCHSGEVLFKEQHEGFVVVTFGVALPFVLGGIVVFHLEQDFVHFSEISAILFVNFVNDDREGVTFLFSAAGLTGDWPETFPENRLDVVPLEGTI